MRDESRSSSRIRFAPPATTRLLPGLFLVLLWACAGCGGGQEEQKSTADSGSRMVPQQAEQAADTIPQAEIPDTTGPVAEPETGPESGAGSEMTTTPAGTPAETAAGQDPPRSEPETPESPAVGNPAVAGEYSLQLGSFRNRSNAEARARLVRDTGYAPEIVSADVGSQTYHRVMIRGLADRSTAERVGRELKDLLGIDYLVKKAG